MKQFQLFAEYKSSCKWLEVKIITLLFEWGNIPIKMNQVNKIPITCVWEKAIHNRTNVSLIACHIGKKQPKSLIFVIFLVNNVRLLFRVPHGCQLQLKPLCFLQLWEGNRPGLLPVKCTKSIWRATLINSL